MSFDGYVPPSILQVPGAKDVAVELYTLTKGHSMAGWRMGFLVGNSAMVAALAKLKSYLDYGTFQPIQIASIIALNEGDGYVEEVNEIYRKRRDVLDRRPQPQRVEGGTAFGNDVRLGSDPDPYVEQGSMEFTMNLLDRPRLRSAPGSASVPAGMPTCGSPSSRTNTGSPKR